MYLHSRLANKLERQLAGVVSSRSGCLIDQRKAGLQANQLCGVQVSLAALSLLRTCINICPGVLESSLEKLMPLLFLKLCAGKQNVRAAAEGALQGALPGRAALHMLLQPVRAGSFSWCALQWVVNLASTPACRQHSSCPGPIGIMQLRHASHVESVQKQCAADVMVPSSMACQNGLTYFL
jgi:hypothetical protein